MRYKIIAIFIFLAALPGFGQEFTIKESKRIDQQVDSILSLYAKYASFTVDNNKISENYIQLFKDLFTRPDVYVFNDIDPMGRTPQKIPLQEYIRYVKEWYPMGLSIDISDKKIENPVKTQSEITLDVRLEKNIIGWYMNSGRQESKFTEIFSLVLSRDLTSCKIREIKSTETKECLLFSMAEKYYKQQNFQKASQYYQDAIKNCSDNREIELAKNRILEINEILKNKMYKPAYFSIFLNPEWTFLGVTSTKPFTPVVNNIVQGSVGIAFVKVLSKGKNDKFYFGIGTGVSARYLTLNLSMPFYQDTLGNLIDKDADNYTLMYKFENLKEKVNALYLDIPVFGKFRLNLNKKWFLSIDVGIKASILANSTYSSNGTGEYSGKYPKYNYIILYGNELSDYGYGTYATSFNDKHEQELRSFLLSAFIGAGAGVNLTKATHLFFNLNYTPSLMSMTKNSSDFSLSEGKDKTASMMGLIKAFNNQIGFQIGIGVKLN